MLLTEIRVNVNLFENYEKVNQVIMNLMTILKAHETLRLAFDVRLKIGHVKTCVQISKIC